jgi:hypothetical protein
MVVTRASNRRHKSVKGANRKWNNCEVGSSFACLFLFPACGLLSTCSLLGAACGVEEPARGNTYVSCVVYQAISSRRGSVARQSVHVCRGRKAQKKQTRLLCNIKLRASQATHFPLGDVNDEQPCACAFLQGQGGDILFWLPYTHGMFLFLLMA